MVIYDNFVWDFCDLVVCLFGFRVTLRFRLFCLFVYLDFGDLRCFVGLVVVLMLYLDLVGTW